MNITISKIIEKIEMLGNVADDLIFRNSDFALGCMVILIAIAIIVAISIVITVVII